MSERDLKSFLHHGELVSRIQIDRLNKKGGKVDPGYFLRVSVKEGMGTGSVESGAAEFTLLRQRGGIRTWKRLDHIVAWTQRTLPKLNLSVIELLVARAR